MKCQQTAFSKNTTSMFRDASVNPYEMILYPLKKPPSLFLISMSMGFMTATVLMGALLHSCLVPVSPSIQQLDKSNPIFSVVQHDSFLFPFPILILPSFLSSNGFLLHLHY